MKKMVRAVLFAVMSVFFTAVFAEASCEKPANLTEIDGVYRIGTCGDLYKFAEMVNNGQPDINGMLTADISVNVGVLTSDGTLSGTNFTQWTPIGTPSIPYKGTFDGDGHTISGLYFNDESKDNVGLFGRIGFGSTIQNVGVVDSYFEGDSFVGGVVGYNDTGHVEIVYNTGTVSGVSSVGGVVGRNEGIYVSQVYNVGVVKGKPSSQHTGGVVGYNGANSAVTDVYNTGAVSGGAGVGGVVGSNVGLVSNAYYNTDFYTGSAVGDSVSGVIEDAEGKTTAELASITLPSYWWYAGSGEEPDIKNGKLVYKLPGLKNVGSQPEIEYAGFQPNAEGYYEISTAQELKWFAQLVNSGATNINGRLTEDIVVNLIGGLMPLLDVVILFETNEDLSLENFEPLTPIGTSLMPYTGTFDGADSEGNAHVISRLYFNDESADNVGLFGYIGEGAKIQNVGVVDSYIKGGNQVGGVVGHNDKGSVSNVYNTGAVSGVDQVGGVVGHNDKGTVSNVYNTGAVSGENQVGGVVGENKGDLSNVYNTGTVGGKAHVGGVAGCNQGSIGNAYNSGIVNGNRQVGGVVGLNHKVDNNDDGLVNNVYNTGTVSGTDNVGGVVGDNGWTLTNSYNSGYVIGSGLYVGGVVGNNWGEVDNSYYNNDFYTGEAFGENKGGKIDNVEGKTTAELASTTLPEGFSSENWKAGSGEQPVIKNGKLVYKLPGLKNVGSQPEIENPSFRPNAEGFYEISNAQELKWFAQLVNGGATDIKGKLTADICVNACGEGESVLKTDGTLNGDGSSFTPWTPIAVSEGVTVTFDGNGHTISGLYFNNESSAQKGLFGQVTGNASISNLGVVDFYVKGKSEVGSLAGQVTGKLNIKNSFSVGSVEGKTYVGGFVGSNRDNGEVKIENSYNESSVNASSGIVGGLVGSVFEYASLTIANSYNVGVVTASNGIVGGLVGYNDDGTLNVLNCYNVGVVRGIQYIGGLIGANVKGTLSVSNSFFVETNGDGDKLGGEVRSSDEFHDGTVAAELHNWCEKEDGSEDCKEGGLNGSVWGQVAAPREDGSVDTWPVLVLDGSGKLVFSIAAELNGGSTKDAFATKYEYGTNYVLPIPERANYTFGGWFTDATFTEGSGITEIVTTDFGPKNVYAKWIPVKYTVKVAVNNSAMGVVEGLENSGVYDYGSEVTLRAVAKTGYEFSDWADDVEASAERTIVVTGNITYTANFKEIPASSSSSDAKSSSSEAASSSSEAKSSSSDGKSSSSSAKSSSSSAKSSSSEAASSSSEAKSSSSDGKSSSSSAKSSSSSAKSSSSEAASSSSEAKSSSSSAKSSSSSAKSSSSEAASSSSEAKSSSSAAASSSSDAKSSSSSAKSSSSEAGSSSSDAESSSSEVGSSSSDAKSSSSDAKSSSSQKESVIAHGLVPQFSVTASGKIVSIAGARPNSVVNVFDMQGNLVKTVVTTAANLTFTLPSAGVYIVKNGYTAKRVNVR